jgi:hypothetical protein
MRMRGLEPPGTCIHTDLNRGHLAQTHPEASEASILRTVAGEPDASGDMTVAKLLPRAARRDAPKESVGDPISQSALRSTEGRPAAGGESCLPTFLGRRLWHLFGNGVRRAVRDPTRPKRTARRPPAGHRHQRSQHWCQARVQVPRHGNVGATVGRALRKPLLCERFGMMVAVTVASSGVRPSMVRAGSRRGPRRPRPRSEGPPRHGSGRPLSPRGGSDLFPPQFIRRHGRVRHWAACAVRKRGSIARVMARPPGRRRTTRRSAGGRPRLRTRRR